MFYVRMLEIISNLLLLTILVRAVVTGMLRKYAAFYLYLSFVLTCSALQLWLKHSFGVVSPAYYYAYHIPNLICSLLLIWVLLDVYRRIVGDSKGSWSNLVRPTILVTMIAIVAWLRVLSVPEADPFIRYQAVALPVQVMLGLVLFHRLTSVYLPMELGRNVTGILLGVSLIVGGQTLNFTSFLFLGESVEAFKFFVQFGYFVALTVFCFSLWDYTPTKQLQFSSDLQIANVDRKLQRAVKTLFLSK